MVYTWSFAAAKPSFRCKLSNTDTVFNNNITVLLNQSRPDEAYCKAHMTISVEECQRCYKTIVSEMGVIKVEPCKEFIFDRKYHQYTLVEEVCIFIMNNKTFQLIFLLVVNGMRSNYIPFNGTKYIFYRIYVWINRFWNLC